MRETEAGYVLENLHGANFYFDFLHEALRCLNSAAILASTVIPSLLCYASNVAVHFRTCGAVAGNTIPCCAGYARGLSNPPGTPC